MIKCSKIILQAENSIWYFGFFLLLPNLLNNLSAIFDEEETKKIEKAIN